jgi:hypothetical protein
MVANVTDAYLTRELYIREDEQDNQPQECVLPETGRDGLHEQDSVLPWSPSNTLFSLLLQYPRLRFFTIRAHIRTYSLNIDSEKDRNFVLQLVNYN